MFFCSMEFNVVCEILMLQMLVLLALQEPTFPFLDCPLLLLHEMGLLSLLGLHFVRISIVLHFFIFCYLLCIYSLVDTIF
jgi:hypothetical protein